MSKTLEQIEKDLDAKIPRDVVSERDGGGGRRLSYLEGWYVIDRLNKVFGPLGWSKQITDVRQVVNTTSRGEFPAYLVRVNLSVITDNVIVYKEAYGYGADKSGQNAHELAIKEAVTDALKVAAKDLGMSLGLALYDKSQEYVDDSKAKDSVPPARTYSVRGSVTPKDAGESPVEVKAEATDSKREKTEETIRSYVRVAEKQKRLTSDDFKTYLTKNYSKGFLKDLAVPDLQSTLVYLQELTK